METNTRDMYSMQLHNLTLGSIQTDAVKFLQGF